MLFRIGRVPELQSEIAAGRTQIFAELAALAIIITHPFGQLLQIAVRNRRSIVSVSFESRTVQKGDVELRIRIVLTRNASQFLVGESVNLVAAVSRELSEGRNFLRPAS